jgi:acyl-coenzyme A synthetase/AMP-(fatty) acid ligase
MIKSSGYRVSPTEVEEVLYASQWIAECVAFGTPHPDKGQEIQVVASLAVGQDESVLAALYALCRQQMPPYMVPARISLVRGPLPRNANGKIDRKQLAAAGVQADGTPARSNAQTSGECLHATP